MVNTCITRRIKCSVLLGCDTTASHVVPTDPTSVEYHRFIQTQKELILIKTLLNYSKCFMQHKHLKASLLFRYFINQHKQTFYNVRHSFRFSHFVIHVFYTAYQCLENFILEPISCLFLAMLCELILYGANPFSLCSSFYTFSKFSVFVLIDSLQRIPSLQSCQTAW